MPYPVWETGDERYLYGSAADHGVQAWADAWAIQVGSTPVRSACYYVGVRAHDAGLDTSPSGSTGVVAQLVRLKDSKRFTVGKITGTYIGSSGGAGWQRYWFPVIFTSIAGNETLHGLSFFYTEWPPGEGADDVPPPQNLWPDGSLVATGAPADSLGALIILANCSAAPGDGGGYQVIASAKAPARGDQNFFAFSLSTSDKCGVGGGGGGGDDPIYPIADGGVDILYWREGYHIATCSNSGVGVSTKWHHDSRESAGSAVVDGGPARCPKLSHADSGPPLGLVYTRGQGKDSAVYRKESLDYGATWRQDPDTNVAFQKGPNGLSYATECWNERTGQRVNFYNDQSQKDDKGKVTGKGNIFCDVYGPDTDSDGHMKKNADGPFRVTPEGHLADNSSFGSIYIRSAGVMHCAVFVEGTNRTYLSADDGLTWQDVT